MSALISRVLNSKVKSIIKLVFLAAVSFLTSSIALAQQSPNYYEIGDINVKDLYVDPNSGNDNNNGLSATSALKTLNSAWNKVPAAQTLSQGVRINILPGTIPESGIPNYLESHYGTASAPIIIQAVQGRNSVVLAGDLNIFDVRFLYILNLTIRPSPAGDTLHCEKCDHLLLRGNEFDGGNRIAHETIKVNQSSNIYLEGNDIHGADDNAVDFVAVQNGHVIANKIHDSLDWCQYAKGGSAYLRIEANEYYNCGTGGFTAGQGTGFEFMTSPWIHYEAYDLKFVNNIVHDVEGAGFGVNGGYNILLAHNTLYKIGARSHVIEVVYGSRSCDGDTTACHNRLSEGGWGVDTVGVETAIPNKNIYILNNLVYNPAGSTSGYQQFAIYGPRGTAAGSNQPSEVDADDNLQIAGNVIWNGTSSHPLGIEDGDQGCQAGNSTCNVTQLVDNNSINLVEPQLQNAASGDFRPIAGGNFNSYSTVPQPDFSGGDRTSNPLAPIGDLSNALSYDRAGTSRVGNDIAGAYVLGSPVNAPTPPGTNLGDPSRIRIKLTIGKPVKTRLDRKNTRLVIAITSTGKLPLHFQASVQNLKKTTRKKVTIKKAKNGKYSCQFVVSKGSYQLRVNLTDSQTSSVSAEKKITVG